MTWEELHAMADDKLDAYLKSVGVGPEGLTHDCKHGHFECSFRENGPCTNELWSNFYNEVLSSAFAESVAF